MRIGDRLTIGFDRQDWKSLGVWVSLKTVWIDFLGLYVNFFYGRKE